MGRWADAESVRGGASDEDGLIESSAGQKPPVDIAQQLLRVLLCEVGVDVFAVQHHGRLEFSLCHMVVSKLEHAAAELHTMYQPMRCKLRRPLVRVRRLLIRAISQGGAVHDTDHGPHNTVYPSHFVVPAAIDVMSDIVARVAFQSEIRRRLGIFCQLDLHLIAGSVERQPPHADAGSNVSDGVVRVSSDGLLGILQSSAVCIRDVCKRIARREGEVRPRLGDARQNEGVCGVELQCLLVEAACARDVKVRLELDALYQQVPRLPTLSCGGSAAKHRLPRFTPPENPLARGVRVHAVRQLHAYARQARCSHANCQPNEGH
mmetsp:Transcript_34566/g.88454  ORF Transcript_34566/g.88454 Transcript_34566/m.88454 type:complete len:320 (-) Transcript_34566:687-1646(-)